MAAARRPIRLSRVDAFDDGGDALADADAHRGETVTPACPTELVGEHRYESAAARAERMTERDRTTVHVHFGRIEAELVDAHDRLAGKRLVQFDEIEVRNADARPRQRLASRGHWTHAPPGPVH